MLLLLLQVGALLKAGAKPAAMAQQMAKVAFDNSLDKSRITPYSRAATEAFDMVSSISSSSSSSGSAVVRWCDCDRLPVQLQGVAVADSGRGGCGRQRHQQGMPRWRHAPACSIVACGVFVRLAALFACVTQRHVGIWLQACAKMVRVCC
jgi:hypothetical protein